MVLTHYRRVQYKGEYFILQFKKTRQNQPNSLFWIFKGNKPNLKIINMHDSRNKQKQVHSKEAQ